MAIAWTAAPVDRTSRSAAFNRAFGWIMTCEAGLSDNPKDRGGRTVGGVIQRTYDAWRERHQLVTRPVDELTVLEARELYHDDFWVAVRAPELPARLALCLFDTAVNGNPSRAIILLQRVLVPLVNLELAQDGVFGPKTKGALEGALAQYGEAELVEAYLDRRLVYYERLVATDQSQAVFADGWRRRVAELRRFVGGL